MKNKHLPAEKVAAPVAPGASPVERSKFADEFKRMAVARLREPAVNASQLAIELGVRRQQLYKWAKKLDEQGPEATFRAPGRPMNRRLELFAIAAQEQVNILQPIIYNDNLLKITMDLNHEFSRLTGGWLSPQYKVIYRASPKNSDPQLETVFDKPSGLWNKLAGERKSLPNKEQRMIFVGEIARDFNKLMETRPTFMSSQLKDIRKWLNA